VRKKSYKRGRVTLLDNESVQIGQFFDSWTRRNLEMFFFSLACLGTLVSEDEVNLWKKKKHIREGSCEEDHTSSTFVPGQVKSGPNMMTQGIVSENSLPLVWKPSSRSLT